MICAPVKWISIEELKKLYPDKSQEKYEPINEVLYFKTFSVEYIEQLEKLEELP